MAAFGCGEGPLEFADWTIPVPEGTPIIEYAAVPMEDRTERIELVEDLVIGDTTGVAFYSPADVAVGPNGRIFVGDAGARQVLVFDADGTLLHTIGESGQGPGEFGSPGRLTIAGNLLVVNDSRNARFSTWTLDGRHLVDYSLESPLGTPLFGALPDGSVVALFKDRVTVSDVVARFSPEGEQLQKYLELRMWPDSPADRPEQVGRERRVRFAVDPAGTIYLIDALEYQVLALNADGSSKWALRVDWARQPYTEADLERENAALKKYGRERAAADAPKTWNALLDIRVDGHGHVYVFPAGHLMASADRDLPVDVYSANGELIFSGIMEQQYWTAESGDFVYSIERNAESEERQVVRYRLVEPF